MKAILRPTPLVIRTARVREIAEGIFDDEERGVVLRLVADFEKISKKAARARP